MVPLVAALAVSAAALAAQQDTMARLTGTVSASASGRRLAGVMVTVGAGGPGTFQVTDSTGSFAIAALPPGRRALRLSYGDRVADDYDIVLQRGRTVELAILLDVGGQGVDLAPIVVEATSTAYALSLAGFYARRTRGFGHFVTGADIERNRPHRLSALLAGTGVVMRCVRSACYPTRVASGRRCAVSVFIDGMKVEQYDIDAIPPEDVFGIEVYRQGADTPAEFSRWSASCGAIVIWTKD
jgi:hypothetical protein